MTEPAASDNHLAQTPLNENHWTGPLMVLMGGVCIGFAPIAVRDGFEHLGPQALAFWRFAFALPILFLLALGIHRRLPRRPNKYAIIGGICFGLDIALWHVGIEKTTVANATFIVNLGNLCVGFFAWLILKERPPNIWFAAVIVAVIGAFGLTQGGVLDPAAARAGLDHTSGIIFSAAAAVFVSLYILFSKMARQSLSGIEAIFWLTLVELGVAFIAVSVSGESLFPEENRGYLAPLFLALVVQIAGQGLIVTGLGRTPAAIGGVMVVVQPVVAAAVAWGRFDEPLTQIQIGGCALILFALWLAQQGKTTPQPSAQSS